MSRSLPIETDLARKLHATYRKWAGNIGCGDHLPETWNAVAEVAEATMAARVDELLAACNQELERRRKAEKAREEAELDTHLYRAELARLYGSLAAIPWKGNTE